MAPRLAFEVVGDVLVMAFSSRRPDEGEWEAARDHARALIADTDGAPHARVLVVTDGGAPGAPDDAEMPRRIPLAIVGSVEPTNTILSPGWVNARAFTSVFEALSWLQIDATRAAAVAASLVDLAESAGAWEAVRGVLTALRRIVDAASPAERVAMERARVAQELDDRLAPQLADLQRVLGGCGRRAGAATNRELARLSDRIALAGDELDGIVWAMEEPARSWEEVCGYVASRVGELAGDAIDSSCRAEGPSGRRVPGKAALHVLRIVQESVRNAVTHAQPTRVAVTLQCDDDGIHIHVEDDGRGFDDDPEVPHGGVRNIRARAESTGGRAVVTTGPGGTHWDVTLPLT